MSEEKRRKVGIMGGTFDPIHIGHLIFRGKRLSTVWIDYVLFMPSGNPPHKRNRPGRASTQERVDMVKLAIADNPHFVLSLAETHEDGYTYTKETLERLTRNIRIRIIILLWERTLFSALKPGKNPRDLRSVYAPGCSAQ